MRQKTCLKLLVLACLINSGRSIAILAAPPRNIVTASGVTEVRVLSQNWNDTEARWFYNVPQGSKLIPFPWFLNLEQPESPALFRETAHILELGYLPRSADHQGNPNGLPIGFVQDGDHLGLSCAACHTTQINRNGIGWLIDGAPTSGDFERFSRRLVASLEKTLSDEAKFQRFASGVLGGGATASEKMQLKDDLRSELAFRSGYNQRNLPVTAQLTFGPGRVDAFGAIINEVITTFAQVPNNNLPANAPVSYPFLWDTPHHDFVQWNGAAENNESLLLAPIVGTSHFGALGRNAGEVLGVFGKLDATNEGSVLQLGGYPSSINRDNLIAIEESLRNLWSPQWPPELGSIDPTKRGLGESLFIQHCKTCHAAISRTNENRRVRADMRAVGTDQLMAANFATRQAKTGVLEGRRAQLTGFRRFGTIEPVKDILVHMVERAVVRPSTALDAVNADNVVAELKVKTDYPIFAEITLKNQQSIVGEFHRIEFTNDKVKKVAARSAPRLVQRRTPEDSAKQYRMNVSPSAQGRFEAADGTTISLDASDGVKNDFTEDGIQLSFDQPAVIRFAYKGRPLNGIWATAPYLHNGSVPNLDELLKPPAKRKAKFHLGTREFDPVVVGWKDEGSFEFDTSIAGNSNAGHEYSREFTDDERAQLIEYLKSL